MIRDALGKPLDHDPDFRWRGDAVTRIENLSDIAFALALGMIISSAEPLRSVADLKAFLFFIIPTAAAFAITLQIWTAHYTFFRRYGVADKTVVRLNAVLIFLVLYLAYPLRYTFSSLYAWIFGMSGGALNPTLLSGVGVQSLQEASEVIAVFAGLFGAALLVLWAMYSHVLRKRALLALSDYETRATRTTRGGLLGSALIAFAVVPLTLFTPVGPLSAFLLSMQRLCYRFSARRHYKGYVPDIHS